MHFSELSNDIIVTIISLLRNPVSEWPFAVLVCTAFRAAVHEAIAIYTEKQCIENGFPPATACTNEAQPVRVPSSLDGVFLSCSRLKYTIKQLVPHSPWLQSVIGKTSYDNHTCLGVAQYRKSIIEILETSPEAIDDSKCGARFADVAINAMARRGSLLTIRKSFFDIMNGQRAQVVSLAHPHYMHLVRSLASEGRCDALTWLVQVQPSKPTHYSTNHGINMLIHAMVCKTARTQAMWEQLLASLIIPAVKNDRVEVLEWLQKVTRHIAASYTDQRARGFLMTRGDSSEAVAEAINEWADIIRYCAAEAARHDSVKCLEFLYKCSCELRNKTIHSNNILLRFLILTCAFGCSKRCGRISKWAMYTFLCDGYTRLTSNYPDFQGLVDYVAMSCQAGWPGMLGKTTTYTNYVMRVHDLQDTIFNSSDPAHLKWVIEHTVPGGFLWRAWEQTSTGDSSKLNIVTTVCRLAARIARQRVVIYGDQNESTEDYTRERSMWMQSPRIAGPDQAELTAGYATERCMTAVMDQGDDETPSHLAARLSFVHADIEWILLFRDVPLVAHRIFETVCERYLTGDAFVAHASVTRHRIRILRELILKSVLPSIGENMTRVLQTLPAFAAMLQTADKFKLIHDSEKSDLLRSVESDCHVYKCVTASLGVPMETKPDAFTRPES